MAILVPGLLILTLYTGGAVAEVCTYGSYYYRVKYCPEQCCGYYYDADCCTSTGSIVGAIIGCILFVVAVIVVVYLIKRCNRTQTGVVIANQNPHNTGVTVVTTNTQAPPQQPHPGFYPPPGSYPGGSYPPPQPATVSMDAGGSYVPPPPYHQGDPAYPPPPKH